MIQAEGSERRYPRRGIRADGFERSDPSGVIPAEESELRDISGRIRVICSERKDLGCDMLKYNFLSDFGEFVKYCVGEILISGRIKL